MENNVNTVQELGKECNLTKMEGALLRWMQEHPGTVVSRESLLHNVWCFQFAGNTRTVDMCIRRLRSKIGNTAIRTVYGKGYMLIPQ